MSERMRPQRTAEAKVGRDPPVRAVHGVPAAAATLGIAGLLPLLAGVPFAFIGPELFGVSVVAIAMTYAALILSFLGGIHWGFISAALIRDPGDPAGPKLLGLSVLPPLAGWVALFLPGRLGPLTLALAFAAVLLLDRWVTSLRLAPQWWMRLRLPLTVTIVLLLLLLAVAPTAP